MSVEIPQPVIEELRAELEQAYQARMQEIAGVFERPALTWSAADDAPPRHATETNGDAWGKRKYHGETATNYDAKRDDSPKRKFEYDTITNMLSTLKRGEWILDCPFGTGFLSPFYDEKEVLVQAVDISRDMLKEASKKPRTAHTVFTQADLLTISLWDKSVDAAVMCRLTRWLTPDECQTAMKQLQRLARKKIVFTARVSNHPHARPLSLFEEVLDGWKVSRIESMPDDPAYQIFMLEPE